MGQPHLKSGNARGESIGWRLRGTELISPFTIEGACNRTAFETGLDTGLIPAFRLGEWVIVDNATFHNGGRIAELIAAAGCRLVYLPPYSPDLNWIRRICVRPWRLFSSKLSLNEDGYSHNSSMGLRR